MIPSQTVKAPADRSGRRVSRRWTEPLGGTAARLASIARSMPEEESLCAQAELMKVLGDSGRLRILFALAKAELCVRDLEELLGASQSLLSHQLATLRAAGLVKGRREGRGSPGRSLPEAAA